MARHCSVFAESFQTQLQDYPRAEMDCGTERPVDVVQESTVFKPVVSLAEAMQVRQLRNSCRGYLTNHQGSIGILRQALWYFQQYRDVSKRGMYRLYLLYAATHRPVGYGALHLLNQKLYVTECVSPAYRGHGYGALILDGLIALARPEQRDLVAEIWAANERSLRLHEKRGFVLAGISTKWGHKLFTYMLPMAEPE
jgi:RimJ/RimL family protein N-acetyltransferase